MHKTAQTIQQRLITERWHLSTTNFMLAETRALLLLTFSPTVLHYLDR